MEGPKRGCFRLSCKLLRTVVSYTENEMDDEEIDVDRFVMKIEDGI